MNKMRILFSTIALLLSFCYGSRIQYPSYATFYPESQYVPYQLEANQMIHRPTQQLATRETNGAFKSLGDLFHRMHWAGSKRCAYLLDEACNNGGIPGSGSDSDWLNGEFNPGKRCINTMDNCNGGIPGAGSDRDFIQQGGVNPGKRGLNLFEEGSVNAGVNGAGSDKEWLSGGFNPGKRCANTMDESCSNAGIVGSGSDRDWLGGEFNPGKRRLSEGDDVPGASIDNDWLHGDDTPGKR